MTTGYRKGNIRCQNQIQTVAQNLKRMEATGHWAYKPEHYFNFEEMDDFSARICSPTTIISVLPQLNVDRLMPSSFDPKNQVQKVDYVLS